MQNTNNYKSGIDYINSMSRDDFYYKVVKGIARTRDFGFIETFFASNSSENIKTNVKKALIEIGVPAESMQTDFDLDMVVGAIAGRSVELR